jgi:uncharacterized protein (TIGR02453 family)
MITKDSLQFLEDLRKNNNREWFQANQTRYEAYKKNYHSIIAALLEAMAPLDPGLAQLEVKNCTFRINRDIRFSKDKSPYKSHMGIWMSPGTKHTNSAGYYLHFEKGRTFIAGGLWNPEVGELKKIRKEIAFFHDELDELLDDKKFRKEFAGFDRSESNSLKTVPKGYEKDHPAIEHLKLKSFTVSKTLDNKILSSKDLIKEITQKLILIKPINDFLNRAIENLED